MDKTPPFSNISQTSKNDRPLPLVEAVELDEDKCQSFASYLEEKQEALSEKKKASEKQKKEAFKNIFEMASSPYATPNSILIAALDQANGSLSCCSEVAMKAAPLSFEVQELFEKIAMMSQALYDSGDKVTTIILDSTFSSALFSGAEIIITEYSTAPKTFNVQINACAEAIALIQSQSSNLIQLIEEKRHPFRFHRIEANIKSERAQRRRIKGIAEQAKQHSADGTL